MELYKNKHFRVMPISVIKKINNKVINTFESVKNGVGIESSSGNDTWMVICFIRAGKDGINKIEPVGHRMISVLNESNLSDYKMAFFMGDYIIRMAKEELNED